MKSKIIIFPLVLLVLLGGSVWIYWRYSVKGATLPILPVIHNETIKEKKSEQLFKNLGPAPELVGITKWLGSEPMTLESLRGKVILINFWTYSSINSIHTLPHLNKWSVKYADRGFVVIGIHTPQFNFEKIQRNVEAAVKRYDIAYPVAIDNNYKSWNAFHNQFWPTTYLIDRQGDIVNTNLGEGNFDRTEKAIRTLLGLEGPFDVPAATEVNQAQTPEIYFGLARLKNFGGTETPGTDEQVYTFPAKLAKNKFALEGTWQFNQEAAVHSKGFGRIKLTFNAAKVFMVAKSVEPQTIKIYVDGQLVKGVVVGESDLYQLFDSLSGGAHTMDIEIPAGGFEAFTFTFG